MRQRQKETGAAVRVNHRPRLFQGDFLIATTCGRGTRRRPRSPLPERTILPAIHFRLRLINNPPKANKPSEAGSGMTDQVRIRSLPSIMVLNEP